MYEIYDEEGHVSDWLAQQSSDVARQALLDEILRLGNHPDGPEAMATARLLRLDGVSGYTLRVMPAEAFLDYTIIEDQRKILILGVEEVRLEDFGL